MDGLHVKPAGAKDLLFTIIGNVKSEFFAPAMSAPCTAAESVQWPALPSTKSSVKATASGYDALKLEDLKVLRRSPDLLNNCKTGQGQLQFIMKHILFTIYGDCSHFGPVT